MGRRNMMESLMLISLMFFALSVLHHCDCLTTQYVSTAVTVANKKLDNADRPAG